MKSEMMPYPANRRYIQPTDALSGNCRLEEDLIEVGHELGDAMMMEESEAARESDRREREEGMPG
jgi:hypothetical protein